MAEATCNVEGCTKPSHKKCMCNAHYLKAYKYGDPLFVARPTATRCRIDGCNRSPRSRSAGICEVHYYRIRRNGTVELTLQAWDLPIAEICAYCGKANGPEAVWARQYCSQRCGTRARRSAPLHSGNCIVCAVQLPDGSRADRQYCDECYLDRVRADQRDRMHRRRVVVDGLDGEAYERIDSREIYERDRWRCGLCHKKVNRMLRYPHWLSPSLDHIVPLAEGGRHVRANVQLAHWICNSRKQHRGGYEQLALIG